MNRLHVIGLTGLLMTASSVPAWADPIVDFSNSATHIGGKVAFGTFTGGVLSLTDGVIDTVGVLGGSFVGVTGSCGGFGCLGLVTGDFISDTVMGTSHTVLYNAGGSISIAGAAGAAGPTLFTSFFGAGPTLTFDTATRLGSLEGILGAGTLDLLLAQALGVDPSATGGVDNNAFFKMKFSLSREMGKGKASVNTVQAQTTSIPEPSVMLLLGTSLAAFARRRLVSS